MEGVGSPRCVCARVCVRAGVRWGCRAVPARKLEVVVVAKADTGGVCTDFGAHLQEGVPPLLRTVRHRNDFPELLNAMHLVGEGMALQSGPAASAQVTVQRPDSESASA